MDTGIGNLYDLTLEGLGRRLEELGEPSYRAKQIYHWLYKKQVKSIAEMTDLPIKLREKMEGVLAIELPRVSDRRNSPDAAKYLIELTDGLSVECVKIDSKDGATACVSSQTGCELSCAFCATGRIKPVRNLSPGEIVAQYLHLSRETTVRNVVVMGMGEPFLNYESVMEAIRIMTSGDGLEIGARRITVSTAGMVPEIYRFAGEHSQVNLAVSLNAPNDAIRERLMPIARYYPMDRLLKACRHYTEETHRRLTFEYVLLLGINDKPAYAEELAKQLKGNLFHVNLIALNPVEGSKQKAPDRDHVSRFRNRLVECGIDVTLRRSPGQSISAACGQLTAGAKRVVHGS